MAKPKSPTQKRAVIYARFSSDNQREESITAQVRACSEYAERKGYAIVKTYTDEAKSATTDNRPGFLRMIQGAKAGLFDVLLIHKLDRFARNRYDSAFYKRELRMAGVRIESVLEQLDDSPESIILESVLEGLAEYYSKNLGREVMKGMRETALECKHTGGKPPLGYDVDKETKKLIINEAEAKAVRLIFEMYTQGQGYTAILRALNEKGHRTKRGNSFGKNSLYSILRNQKYGGTYIFNQAAAASEDGKRNNHASKPKEEIIEIPGGVPAIVDTKTFEKAQAMLKKRQHRPGAHKAKANYLLSGKIWCGTCNQRMVGASSSYLTKKSKQRRRLHYYTCNLRDRTGTCTTEKIRKDTVEDFVLNELKSQIFNIKTIPILAEKLYKLYCAQHKELPGEIRQIKNELAGVEKKIQNLVNALANGAGSQIQAIVEQLKDLEEQQTVLEAELHRYQIKAQTNMITKDHIERYLKENMNSLEQKNPETVKQLIGEFVEKVVVHQENVEVYLAVVLDGGGGGI